MVRSNHGRKISKVSSISSKRFSSVEDQMKKQHVRPDNNRRNKKIFEYFFFQKMSHSAENVNGGTLWALSTYILLQNIKKLERGTLLIH